MVQTSDELDTDLDKLRAEMDTNRESVEEKYGEISFDNFPNNFITPSDIQRIDIRNGEVYRLPTSAMLTVDDITKGKDRFFKINSGITKKLVKKFFSNSK